MNITSVNSVNSNVSSVNKTYANLNIVKKKCEDCQELEMRVKKLEDAFKQHLEVIRLLIQNQLSVKCFKTLSPFSFFF